MIAKEFFYFFIKRKTMIFIVLFSICLSVTVTAENDFQGYGYEVEEEPLKDAPGVPAPFPVAPTGGYTFLGFGGKKAPKQPSNQQVQDTGSAPEMRLGLKADAGSSGTRYVMDIALVLDSSYSITLNGWLQLKEAAKKLIDGLDISPEGTHVSILKFSTDVGTYYMFDASATKEKLKKMIDDLQFDGEWSRMDLALQSVDRIVFVPMGGARLGNVPKKVIIFSDGKIDGPTPPEEEIDWQQRVAEQLAPLRNKNVNVFSVAAGVPDKASLVNITGSPSRVFDQDNVDNLVAAVDGESLQIPITEPPATTTTLAQQGMCTAFETVTLTTAIATTPVTTVIRTETQTNLITATETALTLTISNTQTNTITETVTATATQSLTSTAINTATSTVTATATATEVVTLTTTVGVTSTTYAKATATPIPITIVGAIGEKKRNQITRTKRWYEDYLPTFVHRWMGIVE